MKYFSGSEPHGDTLPDLSWYDASGVPMRDDVWTSPDSRVFQMLRSGTPYRSRDALVLFNGTTADRNVLLPRGRGVQWVQVFDSAWSQIDDGGVTSMNDAVALPRTLDYKASDATVSMDPFSMHIYLSSVDSSPAQ